MDLSKLKNKKGARKTRRRLGKGIGSGLGKTSGKGHKGQKARSGGGVRLGFEGGQMPLLRRLPKRGFNNTRFQIGHEIINVGDFDLLKGEAEITPDLLREKKLVKGKSSFIKVLGSGALKGSFVVRAHAFTKSAKEKIEKAQGKWIKL